MAKSFLCLVSLLGKPPFHKQQNVREKSNAVWHVLPQVYKEGQRGVSLH